MTRDLLKTDCTSDGKNMDGWSLTVEGRENGGEDAGLKAGLISFFGMG